MAEPIQLLLIDDDEDEKLLAEDILEEVAGQPYNLDWCDNYDTGLQSVLAGKHEVYLIDYRLGQNTGIEILRKIKAQGLDRAAIILTGQGDVEVDNAALELGASDYLVKGEFEASDLDRAIRYAIERNRSRQSLRFQAAILQNVHDAVFYVSEQGVVREWNEGAARIFEVPTEEALGQSLFEICPHEEGDHPFTQKIIPLVEKYGSAEETMACVLKSGSQIIIQAKVTSLVQSDSKGYVICASDVTEQKKLQAEILRATENEQRRIGQDIHDDLCSHLSGIGMMTRALENRMVDDHEQEAKMMGDICDMIANAGEKARTIAKGLVPSALETEGLAAAIHQMAKQSQTLFGVNCVATVVGEPDLDSLDPSVAVQMYRIAQEATTNAMKHSDAELIQIRLEAKKSYLELEIFDDGKGMPDELISNGLGMSTMRQRAELIQAEFEMHSRLGQGTQILCRVKT